MIEYLLDKQFNLLAIDSVQLTYKDINSEVQNFIFMPPHNMTIGFKPRLNKKGWHIDIVEVVEDQELSCLDVIE